MEEGQAEVIKHMCRFCFKIFPCGRSLGGHMRSHLINVSSPSDRPKMKLPDVLVKAGNKTRKLSNAIEEEDTLLSCKECGRKFQSSKALFGHMKSHSINGKISEQDYSWDSSTDHHHHKLMINDSQSDNEETTRLCRRKRSNRTKRYNIASAAATTTTSSSSLTIANSKLEEEEEEEEVALSLILLLNSVAKSSDDPRISTDELCADESEVNSPKFLTNKSGFNQFGSDCKKQKLIKSELITCSDNKFICMICGKNFPSYQALGGHRASHKKFKGSCAPTSGNSLHENTDEGIQISRVFVEKIDKGIGSKKNKDHECPICFKIFASGQALGGHKRSHVISDQSSISTKKKIPEIREFLDLNLPAPVEDECNGFKSWWINIFPS